MLYENLNADAQYPNFADSIFSRKQFVGKYCYAATNTYGYPKESFSPRRKSEKPGYPLLSILIS
jgi:hypothetical protein